MVFVKKFKKKELKSGMLKTGNILSDRLSDRQITKVMKKVDLDKNGMVKNIKILFIPKITI